jgi:putative membrane protein
MSWPALNACLNAACAVLLIIGRRLIRRHRIAAHRAVMVAAFCVSIAFLVSYLAYHARVGSVHYPLHGWTRPLYFSVLATHTVLAALVPFLAIITLVLGLRRRDARHRALARWTYPIWLYVSVSGVVVYLMLYQLARAALRY